KRAYCLKTQPATGETYPKSDLFNKATIEMKFEVVIEEMPYCDLSVIRFFIAKVGLLQRH
ncbi:hypothetical protein ACR2WZ_26310, partial [Klebsiella pneumoniae]